MTKTTITGQRFVPSFQQWPSVTPVIKWSLTGSYHYIFCVLTSHCNPLFYFSLATRFFSYTPCKDQSSGQPTCLFSLAVVMQPPILKQSISPLLRIPGSPSGSLDFGRSVRSYRQKSESLPPEPFHARVTKYRSSLRRTSKRTRPLPPELLYDILGQCIVDTIHLMVCRMETPDEGHTSRLGPAWYRPWARTVFSFKLANRQFSAVVDKVLSDVLGISIRPSGRLHSNPLLAIYHMVPEWSERTESFVKWTDRPDVNEIIPLVYRGGPLERLYRLVEYGPWLFYGYTRKFASMDGGALESFYVHMTREIEHAVRSYKPRTISKDLVRRIDILRVQLWTGREYGRFCPLRADAEFCRAACHAVRQGNR